VLVRTDDEVYRVDSVWLGPPRATFPWRARYVSYGVGLVVMILVMFVQRRVGIGLDFFSVAWALVITVVVTRFLGKKIDYERPLGQVVEMFRHEVRGPRARQPQMATARARAWSFIVFSVEYGAAPMSLAMRESGVLPCDSRYIRLADWRRRATLM